MRIIEEECRYVLTEYGGYRLKYELREYGSGARESPSLCYSVRICQMEGASRKLFDDCQVGDIREKEEGVRAFFKRLVDGLAMPVSLPELLEDWQFSVRESHSLFQAGRV